ncbi:MAG TPA: hemolysin family protein [archaeon]|nr:hemolysin family protein [archaeon]
MELYLLIAFPVLIVFSALFSSSETAFFSLSHFEISQLEEEFPTRGKQVRSLLENSDILLSGVLLGNLVVNICATAVATILLHGYGVRLGWSEKAIYLVDVIGMTFVLLVFGEISPKVYAISHAKKIALRMRLFIRGWILLTSPIIGLLVKFNSWFKRLFARSVEDRQILEEELKMMVDITAEKGDLELEEKNLIHNIFELSETMVKEIMVPRTDIYGISIDTPQEEIIKTIRETGHSRFPVYRGDLDSIIGVLYAKDILGYLYDLKKPLSVEELIRDVYYVPETKRCGETLREFQKRHHYMGIVVDEYGGTEGLVTVEDIMEEIIGEIQDEHDVEEPVFVEQEEGTYLVDGKMNIEDLSDSLKVDLSGEGYETLGGYILAKFGRLPHPGEYVDTEGYRFLINKLSKRRIWKVRITRLPDSEDGPAQENELADS